MYVSSYCIDTCGYCNFSALQCGGRAGDRVVYGSDPECSSDELVGHVTQAKKALGAEAGSGVPLCAEYLPSEAYTALREAGLWGIVQWDETLDRTAHDRWHAASPRKREFVAHRQS
jgi:hypothetical protein